MIGLCFDFVLVYDVTRRETFENLSDIWAKEVELYSTNHDGIKILVGNKVDRVSWVADASDKCIVAHKILESIDYIAFHVGEVMGSQIFET